MFSVNWLNFIKQLTPPALRQLLFMEFMFALIKPLRELYATFLAQRAQWLYDLSFSGQVIYLEKLLNNKYNNGAEAYTLGIPTGIYITDSPQLLTPVWLWNKIEDRPPLILYNKAEGKAPVYLWNQSEYDAQIHFIIHVPIAVFDITVDLVKLAQLKALTNKYKAAGRKYIVVNYTP